MSINESNFDNENSINKVLEIAIMYIFVDVVLVFDSCEYQNIFVVIRYKINIIVLYILNVLSILYRAFEARDKNVIEN